MYNTCQPCPYGNTRGGSLSVLRILEPYMCFVFKFFSFDDHLKYSKRETNIFILKIPTFQIQSYMSEKQRYLTKIHRHHFVRYDIRSTLNALRLLNYKSNNKNILFRNIVFQ